MRAVVCTRLDGPDALVIDDVEEPTPSLGEVTVRVEAAALNFADLLMSRGQYQEKPTLPFVPGFEVAGRIEQVCPGVTELAVGDRIMGVVDHGAFAEVARVRAVDAVPIGETMDAGAAAGFPIAYGTAHGALAWRANLQEGETLLVHGAAGGVGLTAVEIGRAMGARVIATARGADRLAVAKARGAEAIIDSTAEDVRERVMDLTDGRGVDVCFDPVGGDLGSTSLRCLAWSGRYLVIGFAKGDVPDIKPNHLLVKNTAAIGFYWGSYRQHDPARLRASLHTLLEWHGRDALQPLVGGRYPLADFRPALATLESRRSTGKVVLEIAKE
ncbi:MAG: NADPH:quinone oxidoreductase family protein [Pseudomonadota bacterium]